MMIGTYRVFKSDNPEWTRDYVCDEYQCNAHPRACLFCDLCTDVIFDFTHGPYMFICTESHDTEKGMNGNCEHFKEDQLNE